MKACVSETLSMLGQQFGQLLELALTREVQVSASWAVKSWGGQKNWVRLGEALNVLEDILL